MPLPARIILARILFLALWVIWAVYWIVAARSAKPVQRRERFVWRLLFVGQALLTAVLLGPRSLPGWLVKDGPYRWIRHPIYTGVLTMMLGTALASSRAQGFVAVAIALIALYLKSRVEERWMQSLFPERYPAYRKASWALVPFVF